MDKAARSRAFRVAIYAHDTYGLGHFRRSMAIAKALMDVESNVQVLLISGSPVAHLFPVPVGIKVVQLPPVVKVGVDRYEPRNPGLTLSLLIRARTQIITEALSRFRPDVLLVDHSPAGLKGELASALERLGRKAATIRKVLGLRDIVDDPDSTMKLWMEQQAYYAMEEVYDDIMVYGEREIFDVAEMYQMSPRLAKKLNYVGYLGRTDDNYGIGKGIDGFKLPDTPYLLVTAGGGGDGVELMRLGIEAAHILKLKPILCVGPLMANADTQSIIDAADTSADATVVEFIPNMVSAMAGSAGVLSMGGYNSLCEVLSAGKTAVVVPRQWPRTEQSIRARAFAARGLVEMVDPADSNPATVALAVKRAMDSPGLPAGVINLGGLPRAAKLIFSAGLASQIAYA